MSMDEEWREFERQVIVPESGDIQRRAMRQAFFGGGRAALRQLDLAERAPPGTVGVQRGNPHVDPQVDEKVLEKALDALQEELEAFRDEVVAGRA